MAYNKDEIDVLVASHGEIEVHAEQLYTPDPDRPAQEHPDLYACLYIDMSLMSAEDREKVYQAEILLREAGVGFDTGSGQGFRQWELDWSLQGAFLEVRRPICVSPLHDQPLTLFYVYWATFDNEGMVNTLPYCSKACRDRAIELDEGACILRTEGKVEPTR